MAIIDDRTTNKNYAKPNLANLLTDDVTRLCSAFDAIDTDVNTVTVAQTATAGSLASLTSSLAIQLLTASLGATTNNWAPTGIATADVIEITPTASIGLTGITAPSVDRRIQIHNTSTQYLLWLAHEHGSSTAANRFKLPDAWPAFLMPGDTITLRYSLAAGRWVVAEWATRGPAMGLNWFNDYSQTWPYLYASTALITTCSSLGVSGDRKPIGAIGISGSGGQGFIAFGTYPSSCIPYGTEFFGVWRICLPYALNGTDLASFVLGLITPSNAEFIIWQAQHSVSASRWVMNQGSGGGATTDTTNGIAFTTGWVWLAFYINPAWTRVDYLYSTDGKSWTKAASIATTIPSPASGEFMFTELNASFGGTSQSFGLDFSGYRIGTVPNKA